MKDLKDLRMYFLEQKYQNNFELVGGNFVTHMFDTLDDIYGALGTYSLKVAVIGTAFQHTDGKRYLEAQWAGIYVKDFYDFNNNGAWDQPLGYWTDEGILRRADSAISTIAGQKIYFKKHKKSLLILKVILLNLVSMHMDIKIKMI